MYFGTNIFIIVYPQYTQQQMLKGGLTPTAATVKNCKIAQDVKMKFTVIKKIHK